MRRRIINFIAGWLETLIVVGFLLCPLVGLVGGIAANAEGGIGMIISGALGALIGTVWGIVFFGILSLLIQNNQTLKDIRSSLQAKQ